ncbi:unnamed protein product [Rhodiola kirilowii]
MSIEIPTDVIREVQKQIREQSGLGSYDPNDAALPSLPAVEDVIAELDPSPASLRCKRCKGSFLNGAQSLFCVFCGAERHDPEAPPEPIKFNSTSAYRWLLDALKLDGSEIVKQGTEENEPNRGQASPKKELTVAELLDLEIRWPERPKKVVEMDTGNQFSPNKSLGNLPGVDVEIFFPSSMSGAASTLEKPDSTVHNESIETSAAQGHEDVDLFENVVSMEADGQHNSDETGNDSSNWATQFQGATSVNPQNESPSFDSFGVSPSYLSAQIDSVFGSEKDLKVEKSILAPEDPSPSNKYSNEDDLWTNFSSGVSEQPDKLEARTLGVQDVSRNLDSYEDEDWILGDQLQTVSGKVSDSVQVDEDDDSYDAWNDFSTSSSKLQHQFNGSSEPMPSGSHASEINLFNSNDLQDNDFGDFSQPALFSSSLQTSSTGLNHLQSESNVSSRMHDVNTKTEQLDGESKSMNDMETLMSQMHDLSFMLESNLSIPKTMSDLGH